MNDQSSQSLDMVGVTGSIPVAPTNPANDLTAAPESSQSDSGQQVASTEPQALRELAEAMDELQELMSFKFDATGCTGMRLSWTIGSATRGYKELSKGMSQAIKDGLWREIRIAAIAKAKIRVENAREALRQEQVSP
jgi:hypothetical protein